MKVVVEPNDPARRAGEYLSAALRRVSGQPTLLMLSGGSSLRVVEHVPQAVLGPRLTITMLDERHGTDAASSNFAHMSDTEFFSRAKEASARMMSTRSKEGEILEAATGRFRESVGEWLATHTEGVVVATLGVGRDGHTAGIFPFPENPECFVARFEKDLVVGYSLSSEQSAYQDRVTVTAAFLRTKVDTAIAYMAGEDKRGAFLKTVAARGSVIETPSRIFHDMKDVTLVTDIVE